MPRRGYYLEFIEPIYGEHIVNSSHLEGSAVPESDQREFWEINTVVGITDSNATELWLEIYNPEKGNYYVISYTTSGKYLVWEGSILMKHKQYVKFETGLTGNLELYYIGKKFQLVFIPESQRLLRGFWRFLAKT